MRRETALITALAVLLASLIGVSLTVRELTGERAFGRGVDSTEE